MILKKIFFQNFQISFFHKQRQAHQLVIYIVVISDCMSDHNSETSGPIITPKPLDRFDWKT